MSVVIVKVLYCDGKCQEPFRESIGEGMDSIPDQRRMARENDDWARVRWQGKLIDLCNICKLDHPACAAKPGGAAGAAGGQHKGR